MILAIDNLKGIMPAIVSPCTEDDKFDQESFAGLADYLFQQGVHGLYVCGVTGDGYNMRLDERKTAAEIAISIAKDYDRVTIVHIGTTNTRDSVELAAHAANAGAAAIASMPLTGRSHTQLCDYYNDIARAAQIPVLIYHIPHISGISSTVDQLIELLDIPGVVGLKFSSADLFYLRKLLNNRPDTIVFSGNDEILTPAMLYGVTGGIGMTYNLFPKLFLTIYEAVRENRINTAMKLQNAFNVFLDKAIPYNLQAVLDFVLTEKGYGKRVYRRPRTLLNQASLYKFNDEVLPLMRKIEELLDRKQNV